MSSLQDMSNFLFISMTGLKVMLQPLGWRCDECAIQGRTQGEGFGVNPP